MRVASSDAYRGSTPYSRIGAGESVSQSTWPSSSSIFPVTSWIQRTVSVPQGKWQQRMTRDRSLSILAWQGLCKPTSWRQRSLSFYPLPAHRKTGLVLSDFSREAKILGLNMKSPWFEMLTTNSNYKANATWASGSSTKTWGVELGPWSVSGHLSRGPWTGVSSIAWRAGRGTLGTTLLWPLCPVQTGRGTLCSFQPSGLGWCLREWSNGQCPRRESDLIKVT